MTGERVMRRAVFAILVTTMPFIAACDRTSSATNSQPVPSSIVPRSPKLKSFDLTDQNGEPFSSKSLEGQPWVASFFFTQCPAACWKLNQALAKWQADHPQSRIKFVSITCDPQDDTPAALKLYANHFKADPNRWTFLTGDMNYITKVGQDMFMVAVQRETHSNRAMVIDRKGNIRGSFIMVDDSDQIKKFDKLLTEIETEE
jgi:cytochrome oxidase Cu insertion factor (SCO1/SenC/PrrC family)